MKRIDQFFFPLLIILLFVMVIGSYYINFVILPSNKLTDGKPFGFISSKSVVSYSALAIYGIFLWIWYQWWQQRRDFITYFLLIFSWMFLIDIFKLYGYQSTLINSSPIGTTTEDYDVFGTEIFIRFAIIFLLLTVLVTQAIKMWLNRKNISFIPLDHPHPRLMKISYWLAFTLFVLTYIIKLFIYSGFSDNADQLIAKFGDSIMPLVIMISLHTFFLWTVFKSMRIRDGVWTFYIYTYIDLFIPILFAMILSNKALHIASSHWTSATYEAYEDAISPYKYTAIFIQLILTGIFLYWWRKKHKNEEIEVK